MTIDPGVPATPAGYVLAGKVSDFMPLTPSLSQAAGSPNDESHTNSESDLASTAACPVNGDCSVKGEDKDAHLIKVIEIPQPAGRYPATKRVAVSFFHSKWYAFLNVRSPTSFLYLKGLMLSSRMKGLICCLYLDLPPSRVRAVERFHD